MKKDIEKTMIIEMKKPENYLIFLTQYFLKMSVFIEVILLSLSVIFSVEKSHIIAIVFSVIFKLILSKTLRKLHKYNIIRAEIRKYKSYDFRDYEYIGSKPILNFPYYSLN